MIKDKSVRYLDNSEVRLTVTVPKEDVRAAYDNLVTEYCQRANIPGFRKGKVPAAVLIRKFGDALVEEAEETLIRKAFDEAVEGLERKPLPYGTPFVVADDGSKGEAVAEAGAEKTPPDHEHEHAEGEGEHDHEHDHEHEHDHTPRPRMVLDQDFTFTISYDTYPQIELGEYKGIEVEKHEYEITEEDIGRELKALQEQNALIVDKKEGAVEKGNIVTISYAELDETGAQKPASKREGFSFEVGTGYNLYALDEDVVGMKPGDKKTFDKSYPEDYQHKELAGKSVRVEVEIGSIREKNLPAIDDDLAQDINEKFKNLEDLRADIRARLEETAKGAVRSRMVAKILDSLYLSSKVPLPRAMLNLQLASNWQSLVRQLRGDDKAADRYLAAMGRTRNDMFEQWKPEAERRLKSSLIITTVMDKEKIEVTEEEITARLQELADRRNTSLKEIQERVKAEDAEDEIKGSIRERKLEDYLLAEAKVKPGEKMAFLDLVRANV